MVAFVVLGLVSPVLAKRLAGKRVYKTTRFVSSWTNWHKTLNQSINQLQYHSHIICWVKSLIAQWKTSTMDCD